MQTSHSSKPRGATWRYTLMQSSYWASYCILVTFSSVYLLDRGFTNGQIGTLISVSSVLSVFIQPFLSRVADGLQRITLRQFTMIIVTVQVAITLLLNLLNGRIEQTLLYGCLLVLIQLILPLCSALGMECLNRGVPLNFGVGRGGGSVSYGVVSALCGRMVLWLGARSLPVAMLAMNLLLLLSVAIFRFRMTQPPQEQREQPPEEALPADGDGRPFLVKYRRMIWILLGIVGIFISHNVLNVYSFQIVQPLGGTSDDMGGVLFFQSILELPTMFGFAWLLKKASSRFWVRISGISFFLHALFTWVAPNIPVLYAAQIFQTPGYALYILAGIYWINSTVAPGDRVQGQAYLTMASTLGSVLATFIGGLLLDYTSVSVLLGFATVAGGVGMVLMLAFLGKKEL